jgi:hypothetical protein
MPLADHELLDFSLFDLARRVKAYRAMLFEGDKPITVKPVLSILRDQARKNKARRFTPGGLHSVCLYLFRSGNRLTFTMRPK